ncbi:MAG: UDP-N-acetylmuramoyl-tripeptide--D-alanyl-D-alanine ligase [Candidatus Fimimorpha sp.]
MLNITVKDIVEAVNGTLLCGEETQVIEHISIDSRSSQGNDIFVPIIGEKVDAHRFIDQALSIGCAATLTSEHQQMTSEKAWIRVDDTVEALHEIGRLCRSRIHIPAVGVTGSVGKTTTREMIATALSAEKKVFKTSKNYNSSVGLPITLSEMTNEDDVAVLELGMNVPGELGTISDLANLDIAVLTNIGVAHIEYFGTQDEICKEKYTITKGFHKDGFLVINGDDPLLVKYKDLTGYPYVLYGTGAECAYRAENIRTIEGKYAFDFVYEDKRVPVVLSVLGHHNVLNAAATLAVAHRVGVNVEAAAKELEVFTGFQNRLQKYEIDGYTVIDDTYNASPASMKAGLEVLVNYAAAGRKIAVLGDMFELGENAPQYHYEVGAFAAKLAIDQMLLVGSNAAFIGKAMQAGHSSCDVMIMESKESAAAYLKSKVKTGDVVYIKASNGMKLKEITAYLQAKE